MLVLVPCRYDIWGATCLEVELDTLTGVYVVQRVDLIEDSGRSMSPYVDVGQVRPRRHAWEARQGHSGLVTANDMMRHSVYPNSPQVEGAFVMGLGLFASEKIKYNPETGAKISNGTWVL